MLGIFNQYQVDRQKADDKKAAEIEAAVKSLPELPVDPPTGNPEMDRYLAAQRQARMDQMKTQMISNMLSASHEMRMGVIRNMPGAPKYKWVWTYQ